MFFSRKHAVRHPPSSFREAQNIQLCWESEESCTEYKYPRFSFISILRRFPFGTNFHYICISGWISWSSSLFFNCLGWCQWKLLHIFALKYSLHSLKIDIMNEILKINFSTTLYISILPTFFIFEIPQEISYKDNIPLVNNSINIMRY